MNYFRGDNVIIHSIHGITANYDLQMQIEMVERSSECAIFA